jgi:exopolyphosphatase/guanosine-5'-triphosphate,3'-diphosphate pyrophosphatase
MPSTTKTSFPIRCAGMDVGSNAFRLVIAEFKSPDKYKVLERVRMPVRLGASVFKDQRIDPATMDSALDAFREFRKKMEEYEVVLHRAVATSATREAKNRAAFLGGSTRRPGSTSSRRGDRGSPARRSRREEQAP